MSQNEVHPKHVFVRCLFVAGNLGFFLYKGFKNQHQQPKNDGLEKEVSFNYGDFWCKNIRVFEGCNRVSLLFSNQKY